MFLSQDDLRLALRLRKSTRSIAAHSLRLQCGLENVRPDIFYVTTLRDPVQRYISDFRHFVDHMGFENSFERWIEEQRRCNFMTKSIAGCEDLESAKEMLRSRFTCVGTVECYNEFIHALSYTLNCPAEHLWYKHANSASSRARTAPTPDLDRYRSAIEARNKLDIKLYKYARDVVIPAQRIRIANIRTSFHQKPFTPLFPNSRMNGYLRLQMNRAFRNLVYKPLLGTTGYHSLPEYRLERKLNECTRKAA